MQFSNSLDLPVRPVMRSSVNARYDSMGKKYNLRQSSDARCGSRRARFSSKSAQDLRFRVLRLLESNPKLSHRDIAEMLGVSAGGVNYCVNALIKVGAVKVQNFRDSKNKLRYAYFLTPRGLAEKSALAGDFLARKLSEYEAIKAEIDGLIAEFGDDGDTFGQKNREE
jgi:EPS-associated MarR family transcriptional regulator